MIEEFFEKFFIGGRKNEAGEWISTEALNAEVYEIEDISSDIAVALKFIDQGEAVTTTHYYVIMNPTADLTAVEDYVIAPITPNNPGDEMAGEVLEQSTFKYLKKIWAVRHFGA